MIHLVGAKPQSHRIKRLQIQASIFLDILRGQDGTNLLKCEGIPEDARAVGFAFNDDGLNVITVYVESSEFPEVQEGSWPDALAAIFTACYPEIVAPDTLAFTVGEDTVKRYKERREKEYAELSAIAERKENR